MATNSVTTDTTNYIRIYLLLVRGGTLLTKTLFIKRANDLSPPGPPGLQQQQIVDQFLRDNTRHHAILSTTTGKNYKNKIYPQTGTTNLEEYDLYLFCFLLTTVCNLPQKNKIDVESLKKTRNDLSHCHSPTLCETDFNSKLTQIKEVFERTLQYINDQSFTDEINLLINKYEQGPLAIDEIVTFYHEVNRMYSAILEKQDFMIQNQRNMLQNDKMMLQNDKMMLQNDKMMLQNDNIHSAKLDALLAMLTSIDVRLPPGTPVDIPEVDVIVEVENITRDKQEELLDHLETEFNRAISNPNDTSLTCVSHVERQTISRSLFQIVRTFLSNGWNLIKAFRKCLLLTLKSQSISSFVSLVRACIDGSLLNDFQGLVEAVRGCEGYADVKFVIIVTQDKIYDSIYTLVKTLEDHVSQEMQIEQSPVHEKQSVSTLKGSLNCSAAQTNADSSTAPHLRLNVDREPKRIHNEIINEPKYASVYVSRLLRKDGRRNLQFKPGATLNLTMTSSSPALQRSCALDPSILQRAPSFRSIRETLRRQTTDDGSTPVPNENKIDEQKNEEASEDANLSASLLNDSGLTLNFDPDNISQIGGCIECVKPVPVFSADEIEEGDHIVFAGAIYDHHAIVVGKVSDGATFRIVEATNTLSGVTVGLFLGRKARITSSNKTFDFSKQKIWVVVYRRRLYSKSQVSERAKRFAEGTDDEYKYDLFDNNCEHFATYCVTGKQFSIQVTKFRPTARLFITSRFVGMSDEQKRNEKEFENKIICEQCYEMNKKLLSVTVTPIKASEDVQVGDIIRYSYYYSWHEAVVLEITDIQSKFVKCRIAHYAFCGLFSYRTIIEEEYKINFDGQCSKLEYGSPNYHVYDPVTVVERAKSRLGEQQFVFFSNDSSHYARWCKLKLEKQ